MPTIRNAGEREGGGGELLQYNLVQRQRILLFILSFSKKNNIVQ